MRPESTLGALVALVSATPDVLRFVCYRLARSRHTARQEMACLLHSACDPSLAARVHQPAEPPHIESWALSPFGHTSNKQCWLAGRWQPGAPSLRLWDKIKILLSGFGTSRASLPAYDLLSWLWVR